MTWEKTGVAGATVGNGSLREVMLGSRSVVLTRLGDRFYAVEGICPHLGGLLADGTLVDRQLTCPMHGASFDVTTGAVVQDPFGIEPPEGGVDRLKSFPVRLVDGLLEVDVPSEGAS